MISPGWNLKFKLSQSNTNFSWHSYRILPDALIITHSNKDGSLNLNLDDFLTFKLKYEINKKKYKNINLTSSRIQYSFLISLIFNYQIKTVLLYYNIWFLKLFEKMILKNLPYFLCQIWSPVLPIIYNENWFLFILFYLNT